MDSPGEHMDALRHQNQILRGRVTELEIVNDLMKSRIAELESAEQKARTTIDALKFDITELQGRDKEFYHKIDKLKDELVEAYKTRSSRSPSRPEDGEESPSKRRKVSLSELVEERPPAENPVGE
jgi:chromosome segregation ATPase